MASPHGSRIGWVFEKRGQKSIWVAEGPEFTAREVYTHDADDGLSLAIVGFSFDGDRLVFSLGNEFNPTQDVVGATETKLFSIPWRGGESVELADVGTAALSPVSNHAVYARGGQLWRVELDGEAKPERILSVRGSISQLAFAPADNRLLMRVSRSSTSERYSFIALYSPESPTLEYLDASIYQDSSPAWSPDGERVAFLRRLTQGGNSVLNAREYPQPDPWQIRVVELATKEASDGLRDNEEFSYRQAEVRWTTPDRLIYASERDGWKRLYAVGLNRRRRSRAVSPERAEVEEFTVGKDGQVFFTTNAEDIDRRHIWTIGRRGNARRLTSDTGIQWSPVPTADGAYVAHLGSTAVDPAHAFVRPVAGDASIRLAPEALPDDFPTEQMTEPEQVVMRAGDGMKIHAQLFRPPSELAGPHPAVMFFHGGPVRQMLLGWHYRQYYHRAYAINQYLASRGYVVLSVNYRLGIGYGRGFRDVPDGGPRGASEYQDVLAGARFLRNLPDVDQERIGLWGGSYGGYLTALGLARNSDLFAAGVDLHGVHDWTQWQTWSQGSEIVEQRAYNSSPVADLHSWRSPVLLVHGDDDRNVPFSETVRLVRELKDRGVEHELIVLPDEPHSFLKHSSWVQVAEASASFFDRKLMAKATRTAPVRSGIARYEVDLDGTTLETFTYKPANYTGERMIIVIHGTLRNADEYRDHAMAMGDRFGALIVTPKFDSQRFPSRRFQFGGVLNADRQAADPSEWTYAMLPKLANFIRDMEDLPDLPYSIIGHSAGGQFVARMSAFQETGAERLVAANPGSELFPTRDLPFGYGFGDLPRELSDDAALQRYLAAPLTLYLGTADNGPDQYFDQSANANAQGAGRYQRGVACFALAKSLAEERGWEFNWRLVEAEGVIHDHEQMFNHPNAAQALFGEKTPD
ncbi:MAG: prolyl oligopeptidase family serine peptidase [Pirellulales bacterium]|nr:prolyl oligopeptidase family serine peptidase [Pirellulales bacterium]